MDDVKRALLGDREAAKRMTDAGVLVPCPWCGILPHVETHDRLIVYECECGERRSFPGILQRKESPVLASAPESAVKEYYHRNAGIDARLAWNTRAPILSESELKKLEETI